MSRLNPSETPWGPAESVDPVGEGIIFVKTLGHGGYWLSNARQAEVASKFPGFNPYAGRPWYEEDCDGMLVCVVFSYLYPDTTDYFSNDVADRVARTIHRMAKTLDNREWDYVSIVLADRAPVVC